MVGNTITTDPEWAIPASQGVTLGVTEVVDGQLTLFDEPADIRQRTSIRESLLWLQDRWVRRISGGLDTLPYTRDFEALYDGFCSDHGSVVPALMQAAGSESRKNAFWLALLNLRKAGHLATASRRADSVPVETSRNEARIARNHIGLPTGRSARERLPYTALFDELFSRFERECYRRGYPTSLTRHGFWRLIVRIMKSDRVPSEPSLFKMD